MLSSLYQLIQGLFMKRLLIIFITSLIILHASFSPINALSLHDLEKRPSLKIAGIKTLHNGKKIIIGIGDIEKIEQVDAIVNAANDRLIFGSGIAGSIAAALGKEGVTQVYHEIKAQYAPPVAVGSAPITDVPKHTTLANTGFKYIIHAVGPDCRILHQEAHWQDLLRAAYQNTLAATKAKNITSIIVPPLGTGIFNCPQDEALSIMMSTIADSLIHDTALKTIQEVILVVWSGREDAEQTAKQWMSALNDAIVNQNSDYKTLLGATGPTHKENER